MDPTANLREQRMLAGRILNHADIDAEDDALLRALQTEKQLEDAQRLAELQQALDEWICRGGFLPEQWKEVQR